MKTLLVMLAILGIGTYGAAQARPTGYAGLELAAISQEYRDDRGTVPDISGTTKTVSPMLKGGLHLLQWLDAEFHFNLPQRSSYKDSQGNDVSLRTAVGGVFAKPNVNVGPVNLYGLVGYGIVLTDVEARNSAIDYIRDFSPAVGVGLQFALTKQVSLSLGYTQYAPNLDVGDGQHTRIKSVGVGMNYTFGK